MSKIRYILALVLACAAPGLGRAVMGEVVNGVLLFLVYYVLSRLIVITEPRWLDIAFDLGLWLTFALRDLKHVIQGRDRGTSGPCKN